MKCCLSVDDEVVASAAPSPSSSPVAASGVPVPVHDVPASDIAPALDVPVSVPDVPAEVPSSVVPGSPVPSVPVSDVLYSVPVQVVPVLSAASVQPVVLSVITVLSTHHDIINTLLLSAFGECLVMMSFECLTNKLLILSLD